MKPVTFAPIYVSLFQALTDIARDRGYALAPHGSISTDFDLIAVPWTDLAVDAEELVEAIDEYLNVIMGADRDLKPIEPPELKPHGRRAWMLQLGCGACVDLSILPKSN